MTTAVRRMGDKRLLDIEISVQISRTACAAKALQINHVSLYRFLLSRPPSNDCWIVEDGFCGNKRHFPRRLGVKKGGFRPDSRVFASVEKALHGAGRSEEHTSELQSLMRSSYAVFCLKKKNSNELNITTFRNVRPNTEV